jgi:HlyD family secretion protein
MTTGKKIGIVAAGLLILGVVVFFSINATRKDQVTVQTSAARLRDVLSSKVSASGELRAKEFVDLQSEVAGVVTDLPVREGDTVQKGDVLLRIDPIQTAADANSSRGQYDASMSEARGQEFQILNAETNLARDEVALRSSLAELEQAENNSSRIQSSFKRKQQLHEDGLISREEYESAQNDARSAKSQLEVAKARAAQTEMQVKISKTNIQQMKTGLAASASRAKSMAANLSRSEDQLKKTTLFSPLNGTITQLLVEKGERAVPGIMSNPQATLMTIADLSVIQAELKVDETDIVTLELGDATEVKVDALPDEKFVGEVTEIGNSPIKSTSGGQQEAKDFKVVVTLKNPSRRLRPGMSCTGEIITATKRNLLVVPIQALTVREVELGPDGKYHEPDLKHKPATGSIAKADSAADKSRKKELEGLFVVDKDRTARFRPVKTGISGDSEIEIKENLQRGEEVVSGSFQTLRTIKDGAAVKIDNTGKTQSSKEN